MQLELFRTNCSHLPIHYSGSKKKAAPHIIKYFPPINEIISPFIGGGGLEIALTQRNIKVYGYDKLKHLVNMWQYVLKDSNKMINYVQNNLESLDLEECNILSEQLNKDLIECNFEGACIYWFLVWRCFRNNPFMLCYQKQQKGIPYWRLKDYHNDLLTINYGDFEESLSNHSDIFAYLDPPYPNVGQLYGP